MKCKSENCNNKTDVTWGEKYDDYCRECREANFQKNKYEIRKTFHKGKTHTFKFSTIIYIILGIVVPFWYITLPLFWYLAYRTYESGFEESDDISQNTSTSKYDEINKINNLMKSGALSEEEFHQEKKKILEK